MRIATWNLEGKWTPRHDWLVRSLQADLLLLTEVVDTVEVSGHNIHFTEEDAARAPLGCHRRERAPSAAA